MYIKIFFIHAFKMFKSILLMSFLSFKIVILVHSVLVVDHSVIALMGCLVNLTQGYAMDHVLQTGMEQTVKVGTLLNLLLFRKIFCFFFLIILG